MAVVVPPCFPVQMSFSSGVMTQHAKAQVLSRTGRPNMKILNQRVSSAKDHSNGTSQELVIKRPRTNIIEAIAPSKVGRLPSG
ncbi:hypothetical protein PG984_008018 [Apiospora sp. TS-2023a]